MSKERLDVLKEWMKNLKFYNDQGYLSFTREGDSWEVHIDEHKIKKDYDSYNTASKKAKESQFEQLWKMYDPFKRGKFMAKKRFMDLPDDKIEYIVYRAVAFSDSVEDKRYLPHLSTWLNQRRWEDEEVEVEGHNVEQYKCD